MIQVSTARLLNFNGIISIPLILSIEESICLELAVGGTILYREIFTWHIFTENNENHLVSSTEKYIYQENLL